MLPVGEVLTFVVGKQHGLCQVVAGSQNARGHASYRVVVFEAFFAATPAARECDGKPLYVLRVAPKNQPLYLSIDGDPPGDFRQLGKRRLALSFALPETFRVSPRHAEDSLPVWSTWSYISSRLTTAEGIVDGDRSW